ncbi:hypothetical protein [Clostridium perfringens]|uniref:hypothetical protein n=2 Tax=Clostridium perfringens TaxID=1502 RepID=UPI0022469423|nr:hypothetical protein [Clostridium perfringens]MCX0402100.1 hypothetical protein [Clostridium perfringens]
MSYSNRINQISSFENDLYKYKYIDLLNPKEKEYINYIISSIEELTINIINSNCKKDILILGNKLLYLWINYDIPLYEKYFDDLNI